MNYYLGIDLGGTNIKAGVIRGDFTIEAKMSVPTLNRREASDVVKDMADAGKTVLRMAGLTEKDVKYVGIGVPSAINHKNSRVVFSANLHWRDFDLVSAFQSEWNIPVFLANDADAAALAEVWAGAARGYDNIVMLTLGTGVGGGLVFNKKLYTGGDGFGTEPGHMLLIAGGEQCGCGNKGCLEAYASVTALIRSTIRTMADYPDSIMLKMCKNDISRVNGRTAFEAAKQGDAAGKEVVTHYIDYLAQGIASLTILLRPQAVILGGGLCNEGPGLFEPLRMAVYPMVFGSDLIGVPQILKAELGNDAGMIGAALLGV